MVRQGYRFSRSSCLHLLVGNEYSFHWTLNKFHVVEKIIGFGQVTIVQFLFNSTVQDHCMHALDLLISK